MFENPGFSPHKGFTIEFLGTLSLVLSGAGIVAFTSLIAVPYNLVTIEATFGAVVTLVIMVGGRFSPT